MDPAGSVSLHWVRRNFSCNEPDGSGTKALTSLEQAKMAGRSSSSSHLRAVVDPDPADSAVGDQRAQERALVERALAGDAKSWETLYLSHYRPLLRFCAYSVGDVASAEDITQETFARALAGLGGFGRRAVFSTWLRGIAINLVRHRWRSSERRDRAHAKLRSAPPPPEALDEVLIRDRRAGALSVAIAELPESQREAFVLLDVQGLSAAEAAEIAGTTAGNMRVRATRARTRIASSLQDAGLIDPKEGPR